MPPSPGPLSRIEAPRPWRRFEVNVADGVVTSSATALGSESVAAWNTWLRTATRSPRVRTSTPGALPEERVELSASVTSPGPGEGPSNAHFPENTRSRSATVIIALRKPSDGLTAATGRPGAVNSPPTGAWTAIATHASLSTATFTFETQL